jgi:hypothetical protein
MVAHPAQQRRSIGEDVDGKIEADIVDVLDGFTDGDADRPADRGKCGGLLPQSPRQVTLAAPGMSLVVRSGR